MRGYDDLCGIARALSLVGERWALLVVRELIFGPKRFTDLRHGLRDISENVLSQRLRELTQAGIVRRRKLGPPSGTWAYELTDLGQQLEPVLIALGQWGSRLPASDVAHHELGVDALIFALQTTFDADTAGRLEAVVLFDLGDDHFNATVRDGRFRIARGLADSPDLTITTDAPTLQALVFAGRSLEAVEQAGDAEVRGDRDVAQRLLRCFPPSVPVTGQQRGAVR